MAYQVRVGSFAQSGGSNTTQSITGLGFEPSAVLFFLSADHVVTGSGSGTFGDGAHLATGWALAGDGNSRGAAFKVFDNNTPDDQCFVGDIIACVLGLGSDGGFIPIRLQGHVQSLNADGFTVYWDWQPFDEYAGAIVHYVAFGGDFRTALIQTAGTTIGNATGAQTFNPGLFFEPIAFLFSDAIDDSIANGLQWGQGIVGNQSGILTQGALSVAAENGANPSNLLHVQKLGTGVLSLDLDGSLAHEATVTGLAASALAFNFTAAASNRQIEGLILGGSGLAAKVVAITQPTSIGAQAISGLGFRPLCLIAIGVGGTSSGSVVTGDWGCSFGASDGTRQHVVWSGEAHNVNPSRAACYRSDASLLLSATAAATGASSTKTGEASLDSFDLDGFTLDWTTCDGTQREFLALAIGLTETSGRNLLTGSTHTVQGSDNLIAGRDGTVTGDQNALFALCNDSPAPAITGNRTFKVCADAVEIDAPVVEVNGAPLVTALDDLVDVALGSPLSDGDVLTYDTGAATWVSAPPAGGGTLEALTDVTIGSPLSDGEVLTYDSGGGVWTNAAPVGGAGLVLLEQHTASASASLDFTSWYSSTYDEYLIEFLNITHGAGATPRIRFSTDGGSSYDSTGIYDWTAFYVFNTGGSGVIGTASDTGISFRNTTTTLGANGSWNGTLRLMNPGGANYKQLIGQMHWYDGTIGIITWQGSSIYRNTTAVDAFQFDPTSGTFTAGTVRVYGFAK